MLCERAARGSPSPCGRPKRLALAAVRAPALAAVVVLAPLAACGDEPRRRAPEPVVRLSWAAPPTGRSCERRRSRSAAGAAPRARGAGARARRRGRRRRVQHRGRARAGSEPDRRRRRRARPAAGLRGDAGRAGGARAGARPRRQRRRHRPGAARGARAERRTEDAGGFLDPLLPGDPKVCEHAARAPGRRCCPAAR